MAPRSRERDFLTEARRRIADIIPAQDGWVAVFTTHGGHTTLKPLVGWGLVNWVDAYGHVLGVEHLVPMCIDQGSGLRFDALCDVRYLGVERQSDNDATVWIEPAKQTEVWIRNRPHQIPPCGCRNSRPEICILVKGPTDIPHARCDCACHSTHEDARPLVP